MNSDANDLDYQAGFPHSDIPGSKLVCQLPEAFRRLPRPSSPVAAKASTICALSLDHITPNDFSQRERTSALDGVIYRSRMQHTLERDTKKSMPRSASLRLSGFLKNLYRTQQPSFVRALNTTGAGAGGANRSRTGDLLRAKQALSQLSYGPYRLSTIQRRVGTAPASIPSDGARPASLSHRIIGSPFLVGLGRFELPTSPLSGVRSNRLSYRPASEKSGKLCGRLRRNKQPEIQ